MAVCAWCEAARLELTAGAHCDTLSVAVGKGCQGNRQEDQMKVLVNTTRLTLHQLGCTHIRGADLRRDIDATYVSRFEEMSYAQACAIAGIKPCGWCHR